MMHQTPWPVIWSRQLRSGTALARQNSIAAARVINERRLERQFEEERFLADVHDGYGDPPLSA